MKHPVVVIGAGAAGLFAAWRLRLHGLSVKVVEARSENGGLLASMTVGSTPLELFYHHFFVGDLLLLDTLDRLGIPADWSITRTGFVGPKHPGIGEFSAPWQLLTFNHLRRRDRALLALVLARVSAEWMRRDVAALDHVPAVDWLRALGGGPLVEPFFRPLIEKKFGARTLEVSAAWLVGRLGMRAGRTWQGEKLGYPQGGFQAFVSGMERKLAELGVEVLRNQPALELIQANGQVVAVRTVAGELSASAVLATVPPSAMASLLRTSHLAQAAARFEALPMQNALTVLLGLERPVSEFYWVNVLHRQAPFGSVIEHTVFRPPQDYGGPTIYLASYPDPHDPAWTEDDSRVVQRYVDWLQRLLPGARHNPLRWSRVVRGEEASLEYVRGLHPKLPPQRESTVQGLFYAGMFRCYPKRPVDLVGQDACAVADLVAAWIHGDPPPNPGPIRSLEP